MASRQTALASAVATTTTTPCIGNTAATAKTATDSITEATIDKCLRNSMWPLPGNSPVDIAVSRGAIAKKTGTVTAPPASGAITVTPGDVPSPRPVLA
jgi:hypothetical protein